MGKRVPVCLCLVIGFVLLILAGCISFFTPRWGTVVDKESGMPVRDAILVRSWDKLTAGFEGPHHEWLATEETVSDEKGKFSFAPRVFFHGIPLLTGTKENQLLVFRPGHGYIETSTHHGIIELTKVPFNRYARAAEVGKVHSTYAADISRTELLKAAVQQEEELIKQLPELTQGVLYKMDALNDVAIDNRGNLYLAGNTEIVRIPRKGAGYDTANIGVTDIYDGSGQMELEIEFGWLYALRNTHLVRINISAATIEKSPLATRQYLPGRGLVIYRPTTTTAAPAKIYKTTTAHVTPSQVPRSSSTPPQDTSPETNETEILVNSNGSQPNSLPHEDLRFAIGNDGLIHMGDSLYSTKGVLIERRPIDVSSLNRRTSPKIVDTVVDHDGKTLVAFYFPSESGFYRSGVAVYDRNNRFLGVKTLPVELDVTGIAASAGRYYACDRESYYVMDKDFALVSRQLPDRNLFGEYVLRRIKVDAAGENLFLIDARYGRLLWYDLKSAAWR